MRWASKTTATTRLAKVEAERREEYCCFCGDTFLGDVEPDAHGLHYKKTVAIPWWVIALFLTLALAAGFLFSRCSSSSEAPKRAEVVA